MKIDRIQRQILAELQKNSRISNQELADRVGLSVSPCWRRVRELEEGGLIRAYVALLDRKKLGLDACLWCQVRLKKHSALIAEQFETMVATRPEVVECYELTGESDYLMKVYLPDMDAYTAFMHSFLLKMQEVDVVRTSVTLREIKNETALPI
ncbi:MAG TPA: Lrp/AsnC family transcriptional regulator [Denitromonas sp.]|uniref:Lrp/AsnC family transcriptional regulator n=1 Tax=Denitromonas sp. TaxID=2734609 RepID=UPI001DB8846C|nr:Lrp/AsnC family transcriptional regulator [Rhodocyclaceae bacterium]MCP5223230.1 Lrp/AsnC family transcriptional regulator [Zoogloeaceae bacterium]HPR06292.1 Lrp/AsnC family transcriptional regulator [Denitromonas sp.]HQU88641.1 Lrp/AsnC family transcriptional regulator [Denitromonas sp.]HQV14928.1 Lrp/AsnC family transcriptional regulator [Denitromonas sp.]